VYETNIAFEIEMSIQALKAKIAREDKGETVVTGSLPQSLSRSESSKEDFVLMKPRDMRELLAAVRLAAVRSRTR
jgi:hypothetical protein